MVRMMWFALLLVAGCKDRKPAEVADRGSAAPMTIDATPPTPPAVDAPEGPNDDAIAHRYEECVAAANQARWDDFQACYAPSVMFEAPGLDRAPRLHHTMGKGACDADET